MNKLEEIYLRKIIPFLEVITMDNFFVIVDAGVEFEDDSIIYPLEMFN